MALKRPFFDGDDGLGVLVQGTKRRLTFNKNSIMDLMKGFSSEEMVVRMEPFLRKMVREEVERVTLAFRLPTARPPFNQVEASERRGLQLIFVGELPSPIFTASRIRAVDGRPVTIELKDTTTKNVVKTGPYSSIKIEILVLDGDFCADDHEDWSENEFTAKVVREREGRRPLVTGELNVTLRGGVAALGDIAFTDNSSWMRCRKFRLGARVLQRSGDLRIKEGRSEAFVVKDHRGELYKKHHPPALDDEIWRLEKIAKDGAFCDRLTANGVKTVGDFLRWHTTDSLSLRAMLDCSTRTWNTIVEHAASCKVDDGKYYIYYGDTDTEGIGLLLNPIYQLEAATFDGRNYLSLDRLNFNQKLLVEDLKKHAYKRKNFVQIDAPTILGSSRPLTDLQAGPFSSPTLILQHPEFPVSQEMQLDFNHASASTSYAYEDGNQFQLSLAQNTPPIVFNPAFPYNNEENGWPSGGLQGQIAPISNLAVDQMSTWSPFNTTWGQGNGLYFSSDNDSGSSLPNFSLPILRTGKPKAAWCKIRAAMMWVSVRRDLAKKVPSSFYLNHY